MSISAEDVSLSEAIRAGGHARQQALNHFVHQQKSFSEAMKFLQSLGCQIADAEDIMQEAFIIFDRNIRLDTFRKQSSLKTYFLSIVKWQGINRKRKFTKEVLLSAYEENIHDHTTLHLLSNNEQKQVLDQLILALGDRCKKLLTLFQTSYTMKEIAHLMDFNNEQVANNEVGKCRKRLKAKIEEDPSLLEFFKLS